MIQRIDGLALPKTEYWVITGGAMVLYGIRKQTSDIDLGCTKQLADRLEAAGYHTERLADGTRKIQIGDDVELFEDWLYDRVETVDGFPVISLKGLILMKESLSREKDLRDIALIEAFVNNLQRGLSARKETKEASQMNIAIKKMETPEEIKGKASVHWRAWHEAYSGIVSQAYLDKLTLKKCEEIAFQWPDNILVAKDGDRVVGFVGYGKSGEEGPEAGEIFALYVLSEYYGTGVGLLLMNAGLEQLRDYSQIRLWLLKDNQRAFRFYQKCGFVADGKEKLSQTVGAVGIRMTLNRAKHNADLGE